MMTSHAYAHESISVGNTRPDSLSRTSAGLGADEGEVETEAQERPTKLTPGNLIPDTQLEIVRWLGQGGMGMVFEVRHLDIERHFAVKLLHRSESVARARRFRREAKTIGNIGSPWVVEIFDFKELSDGRLMYLMELVDGPSLEQRRREAGTLPLARLIGLARQICKGLADAHARGFIHRDIKPENVMLAYEPDGREHVKIVDFGLASLLAEPHESSRAGTPMYMSPEQCTGEPADARTDIYSLGVTLYELGAGRLPFLDKDEQALRAAHVRAQPEPPSRVANADAEPLPPGFDALVLRCMAKDPNQRFANAAEVEAALIELQLELDLPTEWDELPPPEVGDERRRRLAQGLARLREGAQRGRRWRALGALGLFAVVALAALLGWSAGAESRAAAVARAEARLVEIRDEARGAAAERHWIYPETGRPDGPTAYGLLLELEALEIDDADRFGQELREEFARDLLRLGDEYWDRPGGRGYAREFYAHALMFEPDNPRALARSGLTWSTLLILHERAASGEFERHELEAAAPLVALAQPDESARRAALAAIDTKALPATSAAALDRLTGRQRSEPSPAAPPSSEAGSETDTSAEDEPEPPAAARRGRSDALLERAKSAYRAGRLDEAERLYHRSLAIDGDELAALIGLHHIHFDRGEYKDALGYAQKALDRRPRRGDLNLYVGDACMKVFDYGCARDHYRRAKALEHRSAGGRLRLLDERLGKGRKAGKP